MQNLIVDASGWGDQGIFWGMARQGNELLAYRECVSPEEVIKHFRLREPRFAEICRNGLFT